MQQKEDKENICGKVNQNKTKTTIFVTQKEGFLMEEETILTKVHNKSEDNTRSKSDKTIHVVRKRRQYTQ